MIYYLKAVFVMLGFQSVVLLLILAKVIEIRNGIKGRGAKL